ncbi:MAG: hypothetical protein ACRDXC_01055, partial [Acidimicrobiales bacterium]
FQCANAALYGVLFGRRQEIVGKQGEAAAWSVSAGTGEGVPAGTGEGVPAGTGEGCVSADRRTGRREAADREKLSSSDEPGRSGAR